MDSLKIFKLSDIAEWQLKDSEKKLIELPSLQRNFVWRPHQIENLWDSIFRGYPIGSFLLSELSENEKKYSLLDGQQRATAIAIGFHNPWENKNSFWKLKEIPLVWFDFASFKAEIISERQFIFRVCTRSHPWGYQEGKNIKVLSAGDIYKAVNANSNLRGKNHFEVNDLKRCWPWDCETPFPLSVLIDLFVKNPKDWPLKVKDFALENLNNIKTKKMKGSEEYLSHLNLYLENTGYLKKIEDILRLIIDKEIPALLAPKKYLQTDYESEATAPEQDKTDESLNLFIRVNSAGTPLAGEELIYSIYKAHFPNAEKLIESSKTAYIRPSRVLNYAIRLVQAKIQAEKLHVTKRLPAKVKVKEFKRFVSDKNFMVRLKEFIEVDLQKDNVFEKAQEILVGKYEFQVPFACLSQIADQATDAFFILLFRVYYGDKVEMGTEEHRKILGFITSLAWFGKKEKTSTNDGVLKLIWADVLEREQSSFWDAQVIKKALRSNGAKVKLPFLPNPELLREHLLLTSLDEKFDEIKRIDEKSKLYATLSKLYGEDGKIISIYVWDRFVRVLREQRSLVLYAQRSSIERWFREALENELEDFNKPWDWDHIYPSSFLKKSSDKKKFSDEVFKEWHSSIGNLRAWPYGLNRGDSDGAPSSKLNPDYHETIKEQYFKRSSVLKSSFIIDEQWLEVSARYESNEAVRKVHSLVINRLCDLYKEWYCSLRVSELFPEFEEDQVKRKNLEDELKEKLGNDYIIEKYEDSEASLGFNIYSKKDCSEVTDNLRYYVEVQKGNSLNDEEENTEIGIWLKGELKKSVETLKKVLEGNTDFGEVGEAEDNSGAVLNKDTTFLGDAGQLLSEIKGYIKASQSHYDKLAKQFKS